MNEPTTPDLHEDDGMATLLIRDLDHWAEFVAGNREVLLAMYPTIEAAEKAACEGGIVMGGRTAPQLHVRFEG